MRYIKCGKCGENAIGFAEKGEAERVHPRFRDHLWLEVDCGRHGRRMVMTRQPDGRFYGPIAPTTTA